MDERDSPGVGPHVDGEPTVSLADAAIAAAIARAAARGRGADRAPTLEQLLAAFGEGEPTAAARSRVAAAMRMADVEIEPPLATAAPGERLLLRPPGDARAKSGHPVRTALLGTAAVAVIIAVAVMVAGVLGDGERASNSLDPTVGLTVGAASTASTAAETAETSTAATTETTTETPAKTAKTTKTTETTETKRSATKPPAASRPIVVRVQSGAQPTFLCVDDGRGNQLFNGTLDGRRTFRGTRVRLNIGLSSASVTVNGKPLTISGSPAGFDITRKGGARPLALGARPCS